MVAAPIYIVTHSVGAFTICKSSPAVMVCKLFFLVCFLAVPVARGSFWARDQTHTTVVTRATAVTPLDP